MRKFPYFLLLLLIFVSACKPIKTFFIDQQLPPINKLPENVKKIGFMNRVTREKSQAITMDSDFLYFGESRDGSNAALSAVFSVFDKNPAYEVLIFQTDLPLSGVEEMPPVISPVQMDEICKNLGLDLVISMEYFRAVFDKDIEESTTDGYDQMTESATTFFIATLHAQFDAAFRVYVPGSATVFDEYHLGETLSFSAQGNSKQEAKQNLVKKRDAVVEWGNAFGKSYAARFNPRTFKTMRMICKSGDKRMKTAYKYAKKGDWVQAEPLWKSFTTNDTPELRAYALFNLALSAEVNGDLLKASALLKEAKSIYDFKELERYQRIIKTKMEVQND